MQRTNPILSEVVRIVLNLDKHIFALEIDRLYDKMNRPYKLVEEDIEKGKLKLVESNDCNNLYIVYKDTVRVGVIDVQSKATTIKYK